MCSLFIVCTMKMLTKECPVYPTILEKFNDSKLFHLMANDDEYKSKNFELSHNFFLSLLFYFLALTFFFSLFPLVYFFILFKNLVVCSSVISNRNSVARNCAQMCTVARINCCVEFTGLAIVRK